MKKTILTAMLFFAFVVLSINSASAQYVNSDDASDLLEAEIQTVLDNPAYQGSAKSTQFAYLDNKLNLFTYVNERIVAGVSVEDAIQEGVLFLPSGNTSVAQWVTVKPLNEKNPTLTPLHQELEDLLSQ